MTTATIRAFRGLDDGATRAERIVSFIRFYTTVEQWPPTVREIAEAVGLRSSSTVHGHLDRLERDGRIERMPRCPRAIRVVQP